MAVAAPPNGLLDLEKELSCSICTDTLYQPLTLLDCLHTFCGSCLKLWFAWQASQALADEDNPSRRAHPYTCPSCRSNVRATRHDAKITTLLDMYLMANPTKSKTKEEKEEMDAKYKQGEDVIPKLDDIEDRRMVQEVRRMSLREAQRTGRGYERGARNQGRNPRLDENGEPDERQQAVQLEHQSSLRSLISTDEFDSGEMEEEILRQIMEEGLLDGVDLTNMTAEQQDQLSERIAEAYRRRHRNRRPRPRRPTDDGGSQGRSRASSRRPEHRSRSRDPARSPAASPPRSPRRPHARSTGEGQPSPRHATFQREDLLQAYPTERPGHRRRSSESRRQTAPVETIGASQTPAARSATDLSSAPQGGRRSRRASQGVSGPDAAHHRPVLQQADALHQSPVQSPPQSPPANSPSANPIGRDDSPRQQNSPSMAPSMVPFEHMINQNPHIVANAHYHAGTQVTAPYHPRTSSFGNSNGIPGLGRLKAYPEPSISCERCSKPDIQYELHHRCSSCKDGRYNICHNCYIDGRGCLNWYDFGLNNWRRYQNQGAPSPELPHTLIGARYRRPHSDETIPGNTDGQHVMTREPPSKRRREGAFCYSCHEYADDFFYKCDKCNQGEWGFCKNCVNQGKCCTHPLLPLAWTKSKRQKSSQRDLEQGVQATFAPTPDPNMIQPFPPSNTGSTRQYRPLTITTSCDLCHSPISPNQSRLHCPQCNEGATDICKDCYRQLHQNAAIKQEDGEHGWRRCPRGHRMIVYFFRDTAQGQTRTVVNDLVGGHFLKDEPDGAAGIAPTADERRYTHGQDGQSVTTSRASMQPQPGEVGRGVYPPDGGVGKKCFGRWSWIPKEGVVDELMFPKGAEITEVLDLNESWSEGSYAGRKGVFPTKYVRVLEVVTM